MAWNYNDISTTSPVQPAAQPAAPQAPAASSGALSQQEYQKIMQDLQSYSGTPGVGEAAARLLSGGADPQRMAQLLRQMSDAIDSVRANPHRNIPVDPAIAAVVEEVRQAELKKPDPLNLLRGQENQQGAATSLIATVAPVLAVATAETARPQNPSLQNALVENNLLGNFLNDEDRHRRSYDTQRGPVPAMAAALAGVDLPITANSLQFASPSTTSLGAALDFAFNQGPTRVPDARDPAIVAARANNARSTT